MKKNISMNKLQFIIGHMYDNNFDKDINHFCLTKDKSLLYQSTGNGDYSILLGGNWRFELIVDSFTGLCIKFQSFLDGLKVLHKSLVLPESKLKRVFIKSTEMIFAGEGCHYHPFSSDAYWDEKNNILCIGNPEVNGEVIEFTPHAFMVIKNKQLHCLYLTLNNITGVDFL